MVVRRLAGSDLNHGGRPMAEAAQAYHDHAGVGVAGGRKGRGDAPASPPGHRTECRPVAPMTVLTLTTIGGPDNEQRDRASEPTEHGSVYSVAPDRFAKFWGD